MILLGRNKLNRRALLRGAGSIAIALPWLEIMGTQKEARAAAAPAKRLLTVYTPGGTVADKFWPTGSADAPVAGQILKPLEPMLSKILMLKGLSMTALWKGMDAQGKVNEALVGEQHQCGICGWLTGLSQPGSGRYPGGPSVDQTIATMIQSSLKPKNPGEPDRTYSKKSLQLAVRWATGKSHGLISPINSANFADEAKNSAIAPQLQPKDIFDTLFGTLDPSKDATQENARTKSILDYVGERYTKLGAKLGAGDRAKLDQHLTKIRELEEAVGKGNLGGASCKPPTLIDLKGYNATTGMNSNDDGSVKDQSTDAKIPEVGKFMMDMMIMAFACDLTAVGSFQWSDTEAKHTFPWLKLSEHHHFYQHDGGFKPVECAQINTWYSEMHAYLLTAMSAVDMGGHSLLDESVVFFGSELSHPPDHTKENMPFMLAGGGGGLKGGRVLSFNNVPHNNLLVSLLNLFGDTRTSFGNPDYCHNPLSGLTA
jgi:hypothetical protein